MKSKRREIPPNLALKIMRASFKTSKTKHFFWFFLFLVGLVLITRPQPAPKTSQIEPWQIKPVSPTPHKPSKSDFIAPVCTMASARIEIPQNSPIGGYLWPRKSRKAATIQMGVLLIGQPNHQIAVVSAEILLFNQSLAQTISRAFRKIGIKQTLFTASHSHSGPGGFGQGGLEKLVLGKDLKLANRIAQGAQTALRTALLRPLNPLFVSQISTNVLLRRTASTEKLDDRLSMIQCGDRQLWLMHAAHPVTETDNFEINGDWPGLLVQDLKQQVFDEVLYASSSGGEVSLARAKGRKHTLNRLRKKVLKALKSKTTISEPLTVKEYAIKVPSISVPLSESWQLTGPLIHWLFPLPAKVEIQVLTNPNLDWFFLPYEASATLWNDQIKNSAQETFLFHTPFNGQYLGYIIPKARYGHAGPEQFLSLLGPHAASEHQSFLSDYFKSKVQHYQESKDKRPE